MPDFLTPNLGWSNIPKGSNRITYELETIEPGFDLSKAIKQQCSDKLSSIGSISRPLPKEMICDPIWG